MTNKPDLMFVLLQITLFLIFFIPVQSFMGLPFYVQLVGTFINLIGVFLVMFSILRLGTNLTAFPSPKKKSFLITSGIYRWIRHPIYAGVILTFFGFAIFRDSWYKISVSVTLYFLFYYKSNYEEEKLIEKFPEYEEYRKNVGRFFPKLPRF